MKHLFLKAQARLAPLRKWRKAARKTLATEKPNLSYSQEGEDLVLSRIFGSQRNGFYVDIGAHHPFRFSNTAIFYRRGWRGINIDPLPGTTKLFDKYRAGDINLEIGVGASSGQLTYYMFNDPAVNTFDKELAEVCEKTGEFTRIGDKTVEVLPLSVILDRHLPLDQQIDFMTIDAEGLDFDVLQSNDWNRYSPTIIVLESLSTADSIEGTLAAPSVVFLAEHDYQLVGKTVNSVFLKKCAP